MLAFVFGGGGSRGALQVGAIGALLDAGIVPDMTLGTSIGAVNAVALAGDPTPAGAAHLLELCLQLTVDDIVDGGPQIALWNLLRGSRSFYSSESWQSLLQRVSSVRTFDELAIPAYAVATELATGQAHVFGDDPGERVFDALMSSTALSPVYPAWTVAGKQYIDGGAAAVLPLRQAVERGATDVIAFNLTNQLMRREEIKNPFDMALHTLDILLRRQVRDEITVLEQQGDIRLTVLELKAPYYVHTLDTDHVADLVEYGRELAAQLLPQIIKTHVAAASEKRKWPGWFPWSKPEIRDEQSTISRLLPWSDEW